MLYNILSILLGLAAWAVPVWILLGRTLPGGGKVLISGFCCSAALLCQLLELARRVRLGDYAAIADTIRTVCIAAAVLCTVTFVLDLAALRCKRER